jgi:dienelactone hydrolase
LDSFSARKLKPESVCVDGREATKVRLDDLFNAREALRKHAKVDRSAFFAAGGSHGAGVALSAAYMADREPFRAVAAFYPWCGNITHAIIVWKSPIIVFGADKDDWTPVQLCEQVRQRERLTGEQFELIVYKNAYHSFDQQAPKRKILGHTLAYDPAATADSRKKMIEFFVRHLGGK